jgi:hypothetical protein
MLIQKEPPGVRSASVQRSSQSKVNVDVLLLGHVVVPAVVCTSPVEGWIGEDEIDLAADGGHDAAEDVAAITDVDMAGLAVEIVVVVLERDALDLAHRVGAARLDSLVDVLSEGGSHALSLADAAQEADAVIQRGEVQLAGLVFAGTDGGEVVEDVAWAFVPAALLGVGVVEEDVAAGVEDGFDGPEILERASDGVVAIDEGELDAAEPGELFACSDDVGDAVAGVEDDAVEEAGLGEAFLDPFESAGEHLRVAPGALVDRAEIVEGVDDAVLTDFLEGGGHPVRADGAEGADLDDDLGADVADEGVDHEPGFRGERCREDDRHRVHLFECLEPFAAGVVEVGGELPTEGVFAISDAGEELEIRTWDGDLVRGDLW